MKRGFLELEDANRALRIALLDLWDDLACVLAEIAAIRRLRMKWLAALSSLAMLLIIVAGLCFMFT